MHVLRARKGRMKKNHPGLRAGAIRGSSAVGVKGGSHGREPAGDFLSRCLFRGRRGRQTPARTALNQAACVRLIPGAALRTASRIFRKALRNSSAITRLRIWCAAFTRRVTSMFSSYIFSLLELIV